MFKSKKNRETSTRGASAVRFQNQPKDDEHVAPGYRDEDIISSGKNKRSKKKKEANGNGNGTANQNGNANGAGLDQIDLNTPQQEYGMDETEAILLRLHSSLIDFYTKHKPENVDEDVLTILMQFFIDAGGVALNRKLMDKYGEDLNTFTPLREDEPPPPPTEYSGATLDRMKRRSVEVEYGIQLPPPPKYEATPPTSPLPPSLTKKRDKKKKKKVIDSELDAFKTGKDNEVKNLEADIEDILGTSTEDPSLRLDLLDNPSDAELTARDLIEAFYSKHDESKLEKDTGIEKFVMWVEQHSLDGLSDKLKGKYGEGLHDQKKLARRRRNLEDALTNFYLKHDRAKLETRWTIMKILSWTMQHGVVALNRKFVTRYGLPVIKIP